jgi:cell division septation protein DedD
MGYKPYIEKIERNGKTLHRVNVAVVKSREEAEQLKEEVAAAGINAGLVAGN